MSCPKEIPTPIISLSQRPPTSSDSLEPALLSAISSLLQPSGLGSYHSVLHDFTKKLSSSPPEESILSISSLLSSSSPLSFHVGSGLQLMNLILSELLKAEQEVLFVTCFWAESDSLANLSKTLLLMNERFRQEKRRRKFKLRIGFSSQSILQKLFQPATKNYDLGSESTCKRLGLPPPGALPYIDLKVKSIFYRPVSVLHGKYVIIDRKRLFLPSCNVSWEEWLECMGVYQGPIVDSFVKYWESIWIHGDDTQSLKENEEDMDRSFDARDTGLEGGGIVTEAEVLDTLNAALPPISETFSFSTSIPTIFAPQPHHTTVPPIPFVSSLLAPYFSSLKPSSNSSPPVTPQNTIVSLLLNHAKSDIYVQTPNLTSAPLLEQLFNILTNEQKHNVKIEIVTCRNMMVIEQIVTTGFGGDAYDGNAAELSGINTPHSGASTPADDGDISDNSTISNGNPRKKKRRWGATTEVCVKRLIRQLHDHHRAAGSQQDHVKNLKVSYFKPRPLPRDIEGFKDDKKRLELARQSHVKTMIIDNETTMLGSANGDRASWFTSGEVNIVTIDSNFANTVRECLSKGLEGNLDSVVIA